MKKRYLLILFWITSFSVDSQLLKGTELAPKHSVYENVSGYNHQSYIKIDLFNNACNNSNDWIVTDLISGGAVWYLETDPWALPNNGPATMTTVTDGYLLINSDIEGSDESQNTTIEYDGNLNFQGLFNLRLEFEHNYRRYLDQRYVEVSGDGGNTWTQFTITDGTEVGGVNVSETYSLDISGVAGNMTDVRFRFLYIGSWGWHWAIDDIKIKTIEPYDLRTGDYVWGVTGNSGYRLPYYNTPLAQVQPIEFCGITSNIGLNDVIDATYGIDINNGVFVSVSEPTSLVMSAFDTICATTIYTPSASGTFVATHGISTPGNTDTDLTNNQYEDLTFDVVDYIYARDYVAAGDQGGVFNLGKGFEAGNVYDIFAAANLQSVQVVVSENAVEGASIFAKVYMIDTANTFIQQTQSNYYTLTAADLGSAVNLPFINGSFPLNPGESYLITVGSDGDGGLTNDFVVSTSGVSEPQTTFFFDATDQIWSFLTATPAVRMNFDPSSSIVGVDEAGNVSSLNIYPNPANNETTIAFTLKNTSEVSVVVTNLVGQVVYTNALGNVAAGTSKVSINTTELSTGVYMVNLVVDEAASRQKLIVKK